MVSGWVGGQYEGFAEPALWLFAVFSVAHSSTDKDEDRHVLHSHLRLRLQCAAWQNGRVRFIDDLTIIGLGMEVRMGHLVHKNILYYGAVGHRVAVEYDSLRVGIVVGRDRVAVVFQSWIERLNKFSRSYKKRNLLGC